MSSLIPRILVSLPKFWLITGVIFACFLSFFAPRLEVDASTQTLLLENDKDLALFREVSKRYESPNFLVIAYTPKGELLGDESLDLLKALSSELESVSGVESVFSVLNAPLLQNKPLNLGELLEHIPSLSDENADKNAAKVEFLNSPFYKNNLVSSDFKTTAILINLKANDEYGDFLAQLEELKNDPNKQALYKEKKAQFKAYRDELRAKEHEQISSIRAIIAKYSGASLFGIPSGIPSGASNAQNQLFLGGLNMIADDMIAFVKSDLATYGFATLALTMLCLWAFYLQLRYVFVAVFICTLCVGAASGLFGLLGFEITVISSNYIALQLIITLSVVIHLINSYREFLNKRPSLNERQIVYLALKDRLSPCFFAIFTTAIGFVSLVLCDIKPVSSLGIMMSASILLSLVLSFWLFGPLMCLIKKKPINQAFERYFSFTKYCAKLVLSRKKAIFVCFGLAFGLCIFGIFRLEVENSFIGYFKKDTDIYKGMAVIDNELGGTVPLDIVINFKKDENKDAQQSSDLADFEAEFESSANDAQYWFNERRMSVLKKVDFYLKNKEFIGSVSSFNNLLEVGKNLNEGRELDALALALLYNGLSGKQRALLLSPYINIDRDEIHFALRTKDSDERLKRAVFLKEIESELKELLKDDNVEVSVSGVMKLYANMLHSLFSSQISSLGFVILALFATFVLIFRSFRLALIALGANLVPLACVLGLMGFAGLPMDIMSITIGSISLGIGVDSAIHYIYRYKVELARRHEPKEAIKASHASIGYAMYYTSFAVFMGFGVMVSSNFWPTIYFGLLTDLVMLFMLLSALLLLPAMILQTQKKVEFQKV